MDKIMITIYSIGLILCMIGFSGCEFHIGTEWHGKTGVDDQTVTPAFKGVKEKY